MTEGFWQTGVAAMARWANLAAAIVAMCTGSQPLLAAVVDQWKPVAVANLDDMVDVVVSVAGDEVIVVGNGARYRLDFDAQSKASLENRPPESGDHAAGTIPHATVAVGNRNIRAAWLVAPTSRYRHGILGDAIEAGGLAVEGVDGRRVEFVLGKESVFEDLLPRLHDIDGDEDEEVVVVRSYLQAGAALSVFGLRDGKLVRIAETQPIGRPNRWLNPIGAADFYGDARVELAAVMDANGDGVMDVVLPAQDRSILKAVTVVGGTLAELQSINNASAISTSIVSVDLDRNGLKDIIYGLANGALTMIRR